MPRPQKEGIDYFPFDIDFFSDPKIKILKARYGVDGIAVYVYLLCEIYRSGYYIRFNDDSAYLISDDLKMSSDKVMQVLKFLLERSLFDNKLFQSDAVLTSAGIQKRFQLAVKERAKKNPIEIEGFWILPEEKTEPFIKVKSFLNKSGNNEGYSGKNSDTSRELSLKESKVKESKENKSKELSPELLESARQEAVYELILNDGSYYPVYTQEIQKYRKLYPAVDIDQEFRKMIGWLDTHHSNRKTKRGINKFINGWISRAQDSARPVKKEEPKKNQFQSFPQRETDYDAIINAQLGDMGRN
ncbi:DUF4373 domain-containing protein [Lacrimispora indolis]|uniref:DUF4373 domain-containing protein n=1 Tax=Lacrimispora indolis TaxID=69825 RepID=UPI000462AB4A|nr:DUF4373 domain-containing protein [[Clostridium] methoxybenzovorans]